MISPRFLSSLLALVLASSSFASEFQGIRVYAHRGAGFEFDENTIEGCNQSYEKGLRGFEVDIRITKDGQLVLMHDADLSRTTTGSGKVETLTLEEIQKHRTKKNSVGIPSFKNLAKYFSDKPDVLLLLELKTSDTKVYTDDLLETYTKLVAEGVKELPKGTYWFTSFDPRVLKLIKTLVPEAPTGLLTGTPPTPEMIQQALQLGCSRLSVSLEHVNRAYVREVKKAGLQISLWPIKSLEDANLAAVMGTNILCTDIPSDLLKK